jgi:predicted RNase H-like HicB family nuclease
MNYHFITHKEDNGYWAECCEVEGCLTQGETIEDLYKSCEEVINLYLEEPPDSQIIFPLPDETLDNKKDLIKIAVEPEIAYPALSAIHFRSISSNLRASMGFERKS